MSRAQMLAPFAEEEIRTFEGRGGKTMTFIEDETVMDRLDAGYGPGNWQVQVEAIPYVEGVVKVRLGVRDQGEWSWYEDFGYPNRADGETLKEAVSDGIRRCGRYLGIARDLYRKDGGSPRGSTSTAPPPAGEREEVIAIESREGTIALGGGATTKLEVRETPDGVAFGFALETSKGTLPQVVIKGDIAAAILIAEQNDPLRLKGRWCRVTGRIVSVKQSGRRSYFRMYPTAFETRDYKVPVDERPEAESVPLFSEDDERELDAALA